MGQDKGGGYWWDTGPMLVGQGGMDAGGMLVGYWWDTGWDTGGILVEYWWDTGGILVCMAH